MSDTPTSTQPESWDRIIVPRRGFFEISWKELWRYRDLIVLLAQRDLAVSYNQTALGPLWYVAQPLMITAVYSYLFGRMGGFGTADVPHFLFYMSGLVLWGFFAECVLKTARLFTDQQQLISKVYFPRLVLPLAFALTNCIPMVVQFGIFVAGLLFYLIQGNAYVHPNVWILCAPLIILQVAMLGIGIGCIINSLTTRFRDLVFGVQVGLQLWMFGSAIVFPLSRIAENDRWIFFLNPVVPAVESFRYAFLGKSLIQPWHVGYGIVVSALVLLVGLVLFNRAEQTSMDTV